MAPSNGKQDGVISVTALPLDACVIALTGRFPAYSHTSLLDDAARMGADTVKSITKDATHLIATQADFDQPSTKVQQASDRGLIIVSLQWMLDSKQSNAKQPESRYLFTSTTNGTALSTPPATATATATAPATVNPPMKRQASSTLPGPASQPKKTKLDAASSSSSSSSSSKAPELGKQQIAKSSCVQVPLDEECPLSGYAVHIDDDGVIWDASLNQTNAGVNHNKFYRIQLLVNSANNFMAWVRWGRVGERGKGMTLGDGTLATAKKEFGRKFREKSGLAWDNRMAEPLPKKYVFIERSYEPDSDVEENDGKPDSGGKKSDDRGPPPCTLEPLVQGLMELIFNQKYFAAAMKDMNYDSEKMPLGKLSKATIMRGFQTLKDLSAMIDNPAAGYAANIEDLSNRFYSFIPHNFGRNRPPIIASQDMVKREIELLDNLADMKDATDIMKADIAERERNSIHPLDRQYRGLGMEEMTPLDPNGPEYWLLEQYLQTSKGHTHCLDYKVETIFRIERKGEFERFDKTFGKAISDRRLLWHGSRATNFGGILSQGLRIAPPEAPVSGYMFGKGIYLADMSTKSANYCCANSSDGTALLLLCEAELGKPMQELTNADYNAGDRAKSSGLSSTWGKGLTGPSKWDDGLCIHPSLQGVMFPSFHQAPPGPTGVPGAYLQYNEYICYDVAQVRLRYLFRVKMT